MPSRSIFDDPTVAAVIRDWLLRRSVVSKIDGGSYRMQAHQARAEYPGKGVMAPSSR